MLSVSSAFSMPQTFLIFVASEVTPTFDAVAKELG